MNNAIRIEELITFLIDAGMEEETVQHFLNRKIFKDRSLMEYIREDEWLKVWGYAQAYMAGDQI